ncbi:MAG: hypothetical protein IH606_03780 [Burkholderiales bacterium]|nr:hypothetical protein [Burkholderiales bacterium]
MKRKTRTLLSEFSSRLGSEILKVRIFRDRDAFACERELVERDGTSFTMVLTCGETEDVRTLLMSDPYYPRVRGEVWRVLGRLEKQLGAFRGKQVS